MNRTSVVFAAALLATSSVAFGGDAVEKVNYQIGYASGDTRSDGDTDTNAYGVSGSVTLPLGTFAGASAGAEYLRTNLSSDAVAAQSGATATTSVPECVLIDGRVTAALFLRDPAYGRVSMGYGKGQRRTHCDAVFTGVDTVRRDNASTTASAEAYLGVFTLGVTRTRTRTDGAADTDSSAVAATWYPTPNLRTALTADGLDARDTYHFQLEHQPEIFDNTTGLLIEYWTRREEPTTYYIGVGIRYYFNERVELKTRDRAYR